MVLIRALGLAVLTANTVCAFKDASPFFLFSTSSLSSDRSPGSNLVRAADVDSYLLDTVKDCPSDTYIIVSQPGVSAADFATQDQTPHFRRLAEGVNRKVRTRTATENVHGNSDIAQTQNFLQKRCEASVLELDGAGTLPSKDATPQVITINLPSLSVEKEERAAQLSTHDSYINELIANLPTQSWTLIYSTTPRSAEARKENPLVEQVYEMDEPYPSGMHTDLKRDLNAYPRASNGSNLDYNLPLFEKYQFFSSGIFMGISVTLLLLTILYVGISAISGLEVSYMAFSKEMNPAGQRKQQ